MHVESAVSAAGCLAEVQRAHSRQLRAKLVSLNEAWRGHEDGSSASYTCIALAAGLAAAKQDERSASSLASAACTNPPEMTRATSAAFRSPATIQDAMTGPETSRATEMAFGAFHTSRRVHPEPLAADGSPLAADDSLPAAGGVCDWRSDPCGAAASAARCR